MSSRSGKSIEEATRSRSKFSGHGNAKGAAGYNRKKNLTTADGLIIKSGDYHSMPPPKGGFGDIEIGCQWHPIIVKNTSFFGKFFNPTVQKNVDLDLGCLYELHDGTRGAIQAFGNLHGSYNEPPYLLLSDDERTGEKDGYDESVRLNGQHWDKIKRLIIYVYIYEGASQWSQVAPEIFIHIGNRKPLVLTLNTHREKLNLCVIASVQNDNGGMKIINRTEYFPGHNEMDRAFGFGLNWGDGEKDH